VINRVRTPVTQKVEVVDSPPGGARSLAQVDVEEDVPDR
jgi:hypothetical protein